jgi:hypothetical protein
MTWNKKYWDIIDNLYWTPRFMGFKSINRKKWTVEGDRILIPMELIDADIGRIYYRARKIDDLKLYLHGQEEILNHLFNLVFSIAGDDILAQLFCKPLGIDDAGPFQSIGREGGARYGWRDQENVTQQDGLFVSESSLIGVELKLDSTSWPEQVAKYVALMMWEELFGGPRHNAGLLFIVPSTALANHWSKVGLTGPAIDRTFLQSLDQTKIPARIRELFEQRPDQLNAMLDKLRLAVISWETFDARLRELEDAADRTNAPGQTLQRLLAGFRAQIQAHQSTI